MTEEILQSMASLAPHERMGRCLQLAEDALQLATRTHDAKLRHECLALSAKLRGLATEAQRELDALPLPVAMNSGKDESAV